MGCVTMLQFFSYSSFVLWVPLYREGLLYIGCSRLSGIESVDEYWFLWVAKFRGLHTSGDY